MFFSTVCHWTRRKSLTNRSLRRPISLDKTRTKVQIHFDVFSSSSSFVRRQIKFRENRKLEQFSSNRETNFEMSPFRAELFLLDSKFLGKKETLKIRVVRRKIFISHWEENAERTKKNEKSSFRRTTEIIFVQISRASVRKSKRFENRSDFSKFRSKNSSVRLRREHFSRTGARRLSNFDREKSPRNVQRSAFFSPNFHEIRARLGDHLRRYSTIFRSQTVFLRRNEKTTNEFSFLQEKIKETIDRCLTLLDDKSIQQFSQTLDSTQRTLTKIAEQRSRKTKFQLSQNLLFRFRRKSNRFQENSSEFLGKNFRFGKTQLVARRNRKNSVRWTVGNEEKLRFEFFDERSRNRRDFE